MDRIDLDELERLAKEATPGPWRQVDARAFLDDEDFEIRNGQHCIGYGTNETDAAYIVGACNAAPSLIARVRELEVENADLRLKVEELGELCARKTRRLDHQDKVISSQILENAALKREMLGELEKY